VIRNAALRIFVVAPIAVAAVRGTGLLGVILALFLIRAEAKQRIQRAEVQKRGCQKNDTDQTQPKPTALDHNNQQQ
jgi:hypothetical protein